MSIQLSYEAPRWVEFRGMRGGRFATMIGMAVLICLSVFAFTVVTWRLHRASPIKEIMFAIPMAIAALAIVAALTARSAVLVYSDRIEIVIAMLGLKIWKKMVRWADVTTCELYKNMRPTSAEGMPPLPIWAKRQFKVLGFTVGWTIVMSGGDGVGFRLASGDGLLLGSDDPEKLLAAISESRNLFQVHPADQPGR